MFRLPATVVALGGVGELVLSVQVIEEFYLRATCDSTPDKREHDVPVALNESWLRFRIQELSVSVMRNALSTAARWQISYRDAAIVEAAREAGCSIVLSEDFEDGMDFAGVRVENPFR